MNKQLLPLSVTCIILAAIFTACQSNQSSDNNTSEQTAAATPAPNTLTEEEKAAGWKLLFDGVALDQWRGYGIDHLPNFGWVIQNGELVIQKTPNPKPEGFGGDIITKEQFGNFELVLDFMLTDTANSGILYLVQEIKDTPIWHNAPEYQLLDDVRYATLDPGFDMTTHRTCENYDLQAAPANYNKSIGEWNTARILVKDGHVEHWLNGNKCIEYQIGSPEWEALVKKSKFKDYPGYGRAKQGAIGLQDHQREVRFRNIKIRSL